MSARDVLKQIKSKNVEYVDLRFTDPRGKLQHLTMDKTIVDEGMLNDGVFFDGSSIAGWKAINESDMILKPDLSRTVMDPYTSHNTMILFCDILDAVKKDPYERDPRGIAKKAEAYLKSSGIGDTAIFSAPISSSLWRKSNKLAAASIKLSVFDKFRSLSTLPKPRCTSFSLIVLLFNRIDPLGA